MGMAKGNKPVVGGELQGSVPVGGENTPERAGGCVVQFFLRDLLTMSNIKQVICFIRETENMPAYDASNTQAALAAANSQLKFTPMDKNQLLLHLDFWQKNGFLPGNKGQLWI